MALDSLTRIGHDGREIPLELEPESQIQLHGWSSDFMVTFVEWTGEVALPRRSGAVARIAFAGSGWTDTRVAGELSLPNELEPTNADERELLIRQRRA